MCFKMVCFCMFIFIVILSLYYIVHHKVRISKNNTTQHTPYSLPTLQPSVTPTVVPTMYPSSIPSSKPSVTPSHKPTTFPSYIPTHVPTLYPSNSPTFVPTQFPTSKTRFVNNEQELQDAIQINKAIIHICNNIVLNTTTFSIPHGHSIQLTNCAMEKNV